jgi:hypothetical protein
MIPGMNTERQPLDLGKILLPNRRYTFPPRRSPWRSLFPVRLCQALWNYLAAKARLNEPGSGRLPLSPQDQQKSVVCPSLALSHAIRVKSAQYWLILGEPLDALAELQLLPEAARRNPQATKVMLSATSLMRAGREKSQGQSG